MRDQETGTGSGDRRRAGWAGELLPVWLAGLGLALAGVLVALKLDGAPGSVDPHRYERFVDSLRDPDGVA